MAENAKAVKAGEKDWTESEKWPELDYLKDEEKKLEREKKLEDSVKACLLIVAVLAGLYCFFTFVAPYNPNQPPLSPEEEYERGWEEWNDPYDQRPY